MNNSPVPTCGCPGCQALRAPADSDQTTTLQGGAPQALLRTSTGLYEVDCLLAGDTARWNTGSAFGMPITVTYSFMSAVPSYYYYGISDFRSFNESMRSAARDVLRTYSAAANINFVEVSDSGSGGMIRFGMEDAGYGVAAYAYYPSTLGSGGDVWMSSTDSDNYDLTPGGYGYLTLLHEVGHALGLKHPGNYNATGGSVSGPFLSDAADNTDNTVMSYHTGSLRYPSALRPYDLEAVQFLYGMRSPGTVGRLAYLGDSADVATGNGSDNIYYANGGNDLVSGGSGNDSLFGGLGADDLRGDAGSDYLHGGAESDTLRGGSWSDSVVGGQGGDVLYGDDGDLGGYGYDWLHGNLGNDTIYGEGGYDTLYGGQGDDRLFGGADRDMLYGNVGNDTLTGDSGADYFCFGDGGGDDVVTDFTRSSDRLYIQYNINGSGIRSWSALQARITNTGSGASIDLGGGDSVLLLGITKEQLSSSDVLFTY